MYALKTIAFCLLATLSLSHIEASTVARRSLRVQHEQGAPLHDSAVSAAVASPVHVEAKATTGGATQVAGVAPIAASAKVNAEPAAVASIVPTDVIKALPGVAGGAVSALTPAVGGVTGAVGGLAGGAVSALTPAVGGVTGAVGGLAGGAVSALTPAVGGVTGAVGGVTGALDGVTGGLGGLTNGLGLGGLTKGLNFGDLAGNTKAY